MVRQSFNLGMRALIGALALALCIGAAPNAPVLAPEPLADATKKLHYKIFRKGKRIGDHYVSFKQDGNAAQIDIEFSIRVKFLGITAFKMDHKASESWSFAPLSLESLSAVTDRSSGTFHVKVDSGDAGYAIDVNGEDVPAPSDFVPTSFTVAKHLFSQESKEVVLLDTLSGILRPSRIDFRALAKSKDFPAAVGDVRYYEITRLDTQDVTHRIWYDETDAFIQVGLKTKDGHYVEYRRQET